MLIGLMGEIVDRNRRAKIIRGNFHTLWCRMILLAVILFLYMPIAVLVVFSFNDSRRNITWQGFTMKYYNKLLANDGLMDAFLNSFSIAIFSTLVSLILGTLTAIFLWRFRFPLKHLYQGIILLPVVIPEICIGIAFLMFFNQIGWPHDLPWPFNLFKIAFAHILFCFPFVAIIIRAKLSGFNREQEEAAIDLGAGVVRVFWDVWLPYLKPSFIASSLLAFTLSLDDFVITFFTSDPNTVTIPIKIFSMVRFSVTPEINAASTILIGVTILSALTAMLIQRENVVGEKPEW